MKEDIAKEILEEHNAIEHIYHQPRTLMRALVGAVMRNYKIDEYPGEDVMLSEEMLKAEMVKAGVKQEINEVLISTYPGCRKLL